MAIVVRYFHLCKSQTVWNCLFSTAVENLPLLLFFFLCTEIKTINLLQRYFKVYAKYRVFLRLFKVSDRDWKKRRGVQSGLE